MRTIVAASILTDSYANVDIDYAYRFAANWFLRRTKFRRTTGTFDTVIGTRVYNPVTANSDFRAHSILNAEIVYNPLKKESYKLLARHYAESTAGTGEPTHYALMSDTELFVRPQPDAVYAIKFWYWRPEVTWTYGGTSGSGDSETVLSIPDEYIDIVIRFGTVAALVSTAPGVLLRNGDWRRYEDMLDEIEGELEPDDGIGTPYARDYMTG